VLRQATTDHHNRLDIAFGRLIRTGCTGYRAFLIASARALWPLEEALAVAGADTILTDWSERSRSAALRHDLLELDVESPRPLRHPVIDGDAFMLGALYVLEGSRLGARVLVRELPADQPATRYLRHGEHRRFWQSFLLRLEQSDEARASPGTAIAGAETAFSWFAAAAADELRLEAQAKTEHAR
jgi:heme oxygenase